MLYLWLLEITKVRIRFQNYLFKADKRISHHWDLTGYFQLTELEYYCKKTKKKKKKLIAALWLLEITPMNKLYSKFIWRI